MKTIRKIALLSALMALALVLAPVNASADVILSAGDAFFLGQVVDGTPSSPSDEVSYINALIVLDPGAAATTFGTEMIDRLGSTLLGPFDAASETGGIKDESGDPTTSFGDFQYIYAKYGGFALVWYAEGGFGETTVVVPSAALSHTSAYNPVTTSVPEPMSLLLVGLGIGAVGLVSSKRK